jgi:hypothetical protein
VAALPCGSELCPALFVSCVVVPRHPALHHAVVFTLAAPAGGAAGAGVRPGLACSGALRRQAASVLHTHCSCAWWALKHVPPRDVRAVAVWGWCCGKMGSPARSSIGCDPSYGRDAVAACGRVCRNNGEDGWLQPYRGTADGLFSGLTHCLATLELYSLRPLLQHSSSQKAHTQQRAGQHASTWPVDVATAPVHARVPPYLHTPIAHPPEGEAHLVGQEGALSPQAHQLLGSCHDVLPPAVADRHGDVQRGALPRSFHHPAAARTRVRRLEGSTLLLPLLLPGR